MNMEKLVLFVVLSLFGVSSAFAQTYANEATDWGVEPTTKLTTSDYHSRTPISVPGAKMITTVELKKLLDGPNPPILLDVLGGDISKRVVLPGAIFLGADAGDGRVYGAEKARFAKMLMTITVGDKSKEMVFYCGGAHCWLSYNASLRAVDEGYTSVLWYRGGWDAWRAAGYSFRSAEPYAW